MRVSFSFLGGYQLSQSTMVSYAFLPHPSTSCKHKRRERAMLKIQHSPRVQPLLVVFMDVIDFLWLLVPVRLGIRVANPHIKEWRALGTLESTRPNVQSCVLCSIGPSTELFFSDVLKNWVDLDVATHHTQKSASRSLNSLWCWITKPTCLQIIAWATVKFSPHAHTDGSSSNGQS